MAKPKKQKKKQKNQHSKMVIHKMDWFESRNKVSNWTLSRFHAVLLRISCLIRSSTFHFNVFYFLLTRRAKKNALPLWTLFVSFESAAGVQHCSARNKWCHCPNISKSNQKKNKCTQTLNIVWLCIA